MGEHTHEQVKYDIKNKSITVIRIAGKRQKVYVMGGGERQLEERVGEKRRGGDYMRKQEG